MTKQVSIPAGQSHTSAIELEGALQGNEVLDLFLLLGLLTTSAHAGMKAGGTGLHIVDLHVGAAYVHMLCCPFRMVCNAVALKATCLCKGGAPDDPPPCTSRM